MANRHLKLIMPQTKFLISTSTNFLYPQFSHLNRELLLPSNGLNPKSWGHSWSPSLSLTPHRQYIIKYFWLSKCIQKCDHFWGHAWLPTGFKPVIISFYFSIISNIWKSCQNCIKNSHIPITQIHYCFQVFFNYFTFAHRSFLPFLKHTDMTHTHVNIHAHILFWTLIKVISTWFFSVKLYLSL